MRRQLRRIPAPEPRPGFVDQALAKATGRAHPGHKVAHLVNRWETWVGAALGGALVAALLLFVRPQLSPAEPDITLALNEMRDVDVLIDSERALEGATIRIVASGSVALDGFDDEHEIDWRTHLARGSNMLSLPVVARSMGAGKLVAVVEHGGRTRRVTVNLSVRDTESSRS